MTNTTTKKEELFIEYLIQGDNQTEACFRAFDCATRKGASVVATKLMKKPRVNIRLAERREAMTKELTDKNIRFVELVEKFAPRDKIAEQLAENILSNDRRVSSSAIDQYIKLRGDYAAVQSKSILMLEDKIASVMVPDDYEEEGTYKEITSDKYFPNSIAAEEQREPEEKQEPDERLPKTKVE